MRYANAAGDIVKNIYGTILSLAVEDLNDLTDNLPELEPEQPEPPR